MRSPRHAPCCHADRCGVISAFLVLCCQEHMASADRYTDATIQIYDNMRRWEAAFRGAVPMQFFADGLDNVLGHGDAGAAVLPSGPGFAPGMPPPPPPPPGAGFTPTLGYGRDRRGVGPTRAMMALAAAGAQDLSRGERRSGDSGVVGGYSYAGGGASFSRTRAMTPSTLFGDAGPGFGTPGFVSGVGAGMLLSHVRPAPRNSLGGRSYDGPPVGPPMGPGRRAPRGGGLTAGHGGYFNAHHAASLTTVNDVSNVNSHFGHFGPQPASAPAPACMGTKHARADFQFHF